MSFTHEKFEIDINTELLARLHELAGAHDWQVEALFDEALADLLEKYRQVPRPKVMAAYRKSSERFGPLLKELAE